MSRRERSRTPARKGKFWWVQAQGRSPRKMWESDLGESTAVEVEELLVWVHKKSQLPCPDDTLKLWQNAQQSKLFRRGEHMTAITGGVTDESPLFVTYDEPHAQSQASRPNISSCFPSFVQVSPPRLSPLLSPFT